MSILALETLEAAKSKEASDAEKVQRNQKKPLCKNKTSFPVKQTLQQCWHISPCGEADTFSNGDVKLLEEAKTNEVSVAEKLKEASSQKQNLTCKRLILNKEGKALKLTYHVQILQTREQDPPDWLFPQDKMFSPHRTWAPPCVEWKDADAYFNLQSMCQQTNQIWLLRLKQCRKMMRNWVCLEE